MNRMYEVRQWVSVLAFCIAALFASGCATPMALTSQTPIPMVGPGKGLVILVIETSKVGIKGRLPVVKELSLASGETAKATRYSVPFEVVSEKSNVVTHLVSLSLAPGEYEIEGIRGYGLPSGDFDRFFMNKKPMGKFDSIMNVSFACKEGVVTYAGRVKAEMRKRTSDNEPPAAIPIPLIDQRIAGFYPTTFGFTVADESEADIKRFVQKFPALGGMKIEKTLATSGGR